MKTSDRRQHPRFKSLNLLSYVLIDDGNNAIRQGMGRTLDVSEGGILLETHAPIDPRHTVSLKIGLRDDVADIRGKIVYTRKSKGGRVESGIAFKRPDEVQQKILRKYIKAFYEEKEREAKSLVNPE